MNTILSKIALLKAVFFAGLLAISPALTAEMPSQPKPIWNDPHAEIDGATLAKDARRDPNKYCVDCHGRFSSFEHGGKHFQATTKSPNNNKPLNCVSCHGNISENHRKGVKDVMRFNPHGKAKNPELERTPQEQNAVCFACHNPDKLRAVFWAHDVHANKMACVNCHKLHPEIEPMKATNPKQRVRLCVDCHSNIHEKKAKQLEQAKEEK